MGFKQDEEKYFVSVLVNRINNVLGEKRFNIDTSKNYTGRLSPDGTMLAVLCSITIPNVTGGAKGNDLLQLKNLHPEALSCKGPSVLLMAKVEDIDSINLQDEDKLIYIIGDVFTDIFKLDTDTPKVILEISNDNNTVFVGVPEANGIGKVMIFVVTEGKLLFEQWIASPDRCKGGLFGYSITASKDNQILAIGAPMAGHKNAGKVYFYKKHLDRDTYFFVGSRQCEFNPPNSFFGYKIIETEGNCVFRVLGIHTSMKIVIE